MSQAATSCQTPEAIQALLDDLKRSAGHNSVIARLDALNEVCCAHWQAGNKNFTASALTQPELGLSRYTVGVDPYRALRRAWAEHAGGWAEHEERVPARLSPDMTEDEVLRALRDYAGGAAKHLALLHDVCRERLKRGNLDFRMRALARACSQRADRRVALGSPEYRWLVDWWARRAGDGAVVTQVPQLHPLPDTSQVTPDQAYAALTEHVTQQGRRMERRLGILRVAHEVCREHFEAGERDFAYTTIGRLSEQAGGMRRHNVMDPRVGVLVRALIDVWARHAGDSPSPSDAPEPEPEVHPDEVLQGLLAFMSAAGWRRRSKVDRDAVLTALHEECAARHARGDKDYTRASLVTAVNARLSGDGREHCVINKGDLNEGRECGRLWRAWVDHSGGFTRRPAKAKPEKKAAADSTASRRAAVLRDDLSAWLERDASIAAWLDSAQAWYAKQLRNKDNCRRALESFILDFVLVNDVERDPRLFLRHDAAVPSLWEYLESTSAITHVPLVARYNKIVEFLDWLTSRLSAADPDGRWQNPYARESYRASGVAESVRSVLPYEYVMRLRAFVCEGDSFRDWRWARGVSNADWFEVDPSVIDHSDPDCVWRTRTITRDFALVEVTEMWCPARAVAVYIKLCLPLRTYQVRMLDSGEADTYRFELGSDGRVVWRLNDGPLASGDERNPERDGLFHRPSQAPDKAYLHINTNKTADIDKDEKKKDFVMPFAHPDVLFWAAKLRDWQAKYNPLTEPTQWTETADTESGGTDRRVLAQRGTACFLFRHRARSLTARQRTPITDGEFRFFYWHLMLRLEQELEAAGETDAVGGTQRFVADRQNPRSALYYPPHALRVSLITHFLVDGGVPIEIISKYFAGHSSLVMTMYYVKLRDSSISERLLSAERSLQANAKEQLAQWHKDQRHNPDVIGRLFANPSEDAVRAMQGATTNHIAFLGHGVCTTAQQGCQVGGEALAPKKYAPVPGWPEQNCVQCRFFLTGPAWLGGLMAYGNLVSYQLNPVRDELVRVMTDLDVLRAERQQYGSEGLPGPRKAEFDQLRNRKRRILGEVDALVGKLDATYVWIKAALDIGAQTADGDDVALVSAADAIDVRIELSDAATQQLQTICENATVYPTLPLPQDAVWRRSQIIDRLLTNHGQPPVMFQLTPEEQLLVGNHFFRFLSTRCGGPDAAFDALDGRRQLADDTLQPLLSALEPHARQGLSLEAFLNQTAALEDARATQAPERTNQRLALTDGDRS